MPKPFRPQFVDGDAVGLRSENAAPASPTSTALLMRNVPVVWKSREDLRADSGVDVG